VFPIRDENTAYRPPVVTSLLIAANILVFTLELAQGSQIESFVHEWGLIPVEFMQGHKLYGLSWMSPYWNVVTSMFLHGGLFHLVGNMWFLWIFGDNVESRYGHWGYAGFYLCTGIVAALAHVFMNPLSALPTVGASGAVSGVLGAYFVLYPSVRVRTLLWFGVFFQMVRVPAILFLGLWFVYQLLGGMLDNADMGGGGVAFAAHIGGGVAGFIITIAIKVAGWIPEER
jgi:membrane associated rhomboid family serine protease